MKVDQFWREIYEFSLNAKVSSMKKENYVVVTYPRKMTYWREFLKKPEYIFLRSTVFKIENGEAVKVFPSFTKFPNLHEDEKVRRLVENNDFDLVFEKIDGSFLAVSNDEGKLVVRSKSGFNNFVTATWPRFYEENKHLVEKMFEKVETLMFEVYCGKPHSAFVNSIDMLDMLCQERVKYYLLGGVDYRGNLVPPTDIDPTGSLLPAQIKVKDFEELKSLVKTNKEKEGVVIWTKPFFEYKGVYANPLVKFKSTWYFVFVTMKGSLSALLQSWERVRDDVGVLDEELHQSVEELYNRITSLKMKVRNLREKGVEDPLVLNFNKVVYSKLAGLPISLEGVEKANKILDRYERRIEEIKKSLER